MSEYLKKVEEAKRLKEQAEAKLREASAIAASCYHTWGKTSFDPIITKGGYFEGDAPGTCGSDYRPGFYYQGTSTPRWKRVCNKCGFEQKTEVKETRMSGDGLTFEVPRFS